MSQKTFLEDLSNWTGEQCRLNQHDAVPKLINSIDANNIDCLGVNTGFIHQNVMDSYTGKYTKYFHKVIHLVLTNFTVVCEAQELESLIFKQLSEKVVGCYGRIYNEVIKLAATGHLMNNVKHLLEQSARLIDGFHICIEHVISTCDKINIQWVHSLMPAVLHVLKIAYTHCKDSSNIYGPLLGPISEQLSFLFKKAHNLQMVLLKLIDKIEIAMERKPQDLQDMTIIIQELHVISQIATSLDVKIMVTLWKVISRLACQYKELLQNRIDYSPIIMCVCDDMLKSYDYVLQMLPQGDDATVDEKAFTKHLKILGFQMKIVIKLIDEFQSSLSAECIHRVHFFILNVNRHTPPSLTSKSISRIYIQEIQKQFANGTEPLLAKLVANTHFIEIVTCAKLTEDYKNLHVAHCMMLLTMSELLETQTNQTQLMWLTSNGRFSLLSAVFNTLQHCYVELNTSMHVSHNGKEVGFYECILVKLCALVASYPVQLFHEVENCLLENVLQPNIHNAVLATDLWCFVARYGSADLCKQNCVFLTHLWLSTGVSTSFISTQLTLLIRRLLKFLAPEHQAEYICTFPIKANLGLWSIVPLHAFVVSNNGTIVNQLVQLCVKHINNWTLTEEILVKDTVRLYESLLCLCNALNNPFITQNYSAEMQFSVLQSTCLHLLNALADREFVKIKILELCASQVLDILANLLLVPDLMDNNDILMILQFIHSLLLDTDQSLDTFKMSSIKFLQSLAKRTLSPSDQQSEILQILPQIFSYLLSDHNDIVEFSSLQMFAEFAEETPHESIVPESLEQDATVQNKVVAYLNVLSSGHIPEPISIKQLVSQHLQQLELSKSDLSSLYTPTIWPECNKSTRQLPATEEQRNIVGSLKTNIEQLSTTIANPKLLPNEIKQELRHCYSMLSKLL